MTPETPLTEVAAHIPREVAQMMVELSPPVQESILISMRALMVYWEGRGLDLDPVALEVALGGAVTVIAGLTAELDRALAQKAALTHQVRVADILISKLCTPVSQEAKES